MTDARGFSGRDESVLLPGLGVGRYAIGLCGLDDLSRVEELKLGDGSLDDASGMNGWFDLMLEGVLRDLAVVGLLSGVWAKKVV